jgi:hypothetical protein
VALLPFKIAQTPAISLVRRAWQRVIHDELLFALAVGLLIWLLTALTLIGVLLLLQEVSHA